MYIWGYGGKVPHIRVLRWIEMNGLASHTTFSQRKYFWLPLDGTLDWYLKLVWRRMRSFTVHEIKPRFISHSVRSLVTLLNELYHHLLALQFLRRIYV